MRMTTGIEPEPAEWRTRWAAGQLGLSPDASGPEARAAFLRRLPEWEFMPPVGAHRALELLKGCPVRGTDHAQAEFEALLAEQERLRAEVEGFAGRFWQLSTDERVTIWNRLSQGCGAFPALRERLQRLVPGLHLELLSEPPEDMHVKMLAQGVQELFVLRPAEQARKRREHLRRLRRDFSAWRDAVRRVRVNFPEVAALGEPFLSELETVERPRKRQPTPRKKSTDLTRKIIHPWWAAPLTILVLMLLRGVGDPSRTVPSRSPPPFKFNRFPDPQLPGAAPGRKRLLGEDGWQRLQEKQNPEKPVAPEQKGNKRLLPPPSAAQTTENPAASQPRTAPP
jgi:hypothetical protein